MDLSESEVNYNNRDIPSYKSLESEAKCETQENPSHYENKLLNTGTRSIKRKKSLKKKRKSSKSKPSQSDNVDQDEMIYPYAMLLQMVSQHADVSNSDEIISFERINLFKKLDYATLCYPYASVLQELHKSVRKELKNNEEDIYNLSGVKMANLMKNLHFKACLDNHIETEKQSQEIKALETTCSKLLLDMIQKYDIQENSNNSSFTKGSISNILRESMNKSQCIVAMKEMSSSAILHTLSLQAEYDNKFNEEIKEDKDKLESVLNLHKEEFKQKPTAQFKPRDNACELSQKNSSQQRKFKYNHTPLRKSKLAKYYRYKPTMQTVNIDINKNTKHVEFESNQQDNSNKSLRELLTEPVQQPSQSLKSLHKLPSSKEQSNLSVQSSSSVLQSSPLKESLLKQSSQQKTLKTNCSPSRNDKSLKDLLTHPQSSLLKEYLLKPTEAEKSSSNNSSLPRLSEQNFVFSRLLQHFKSVSEKKQYYVEDSPSSSLLKEILLQNSSQIQEGSNDYDIYSENLGKEQDEVSSLQNLSCNRVPLFKSEDINSSEYVDDGNSNSMCEIKCEVKCENEFLDDVHECDICHLPFASEVDRNNHLTLFHGGEELRDSDPKLESDDINPGCLIPRGSVNQLMKSFIEEKMSA